MGGLSKKAYQFETIAKKSKKPVVTLDGGALLFKNRTLSKGQEIQEKITAEAIIKSYNLIGYDAVGVSALDLSAGIDFLTELTKISDFPWLSANLVEKSSTKPLFSPSTIVRSGSLNVGVIGLTGSLLHLSIPDKNKYTAIEWQNILPEIIDTLSSKTDLIILLSSLQPSENKEISRQLSKINIIIQAGVSTANMAPTLANNTIICQTGKQGKYIGILDIDWQLSKKWGDNSADLLTKNKNSLDRLDWQLSKYNKYSNPLIDLKNNSQALKRYKSLLSSKEQIELQIAQLSENLSQQTNVSSTPSSYKNKFIAMQTSMPDQINVMKLVENLNDEIDHLGKSMKRVPGPMPPEYTGIKRCGNCHQEHLSAWQQTRHAMAYNTLVVKNKQFNLDCLPCHVTSVSSENAIDALALNEQLRNVTCEACHGKGMMHANAPETVKSEVPSQEVCLACHSQDHDDDFNYHRDIKLIH